MAATSLTAAQALALNSTEGVTVGNFTETVRQRLREVDLASDFFWELRPLGNRGELGIWGPGPDGLNWRRGEIDFSNIDVLSRYGGPVVRVYFRNLVCNAEDTKLVIQCIRQLFLDTIGKYRLALRNRVVMLTADPQDVNSVAHKVLRLLVREGLCDLGSIFLLNPDNDFLFMGATTGLRENHLKKDVYYTLDDKSWVRKVFSGQEILVEHADGALISENRFGENLYGTQIRSRIFVPFTTQAENTASKRRWPVSGVFRLIRCPAQREPGVMLWPRNFTWLDSYFVAFVGEMLHVVLQSYLSSWWAHSFAEKIVHGIKTGVDGSLEQVRVINYLLFPNRVVKGRLPFLPPDWSRSIALQADVGKLIQNAEFFLLDASEQVSVVTDGILDGTKLDRERDVGIIKRLFSEVLQKAVNLAPQLAVVNNSKAPPHFSNLKEAGAQNLPAVVGDEGLVLSVFRNIIENSIKYAKPTERAEITFSFEISDEFVRVLVQDNGIGVPPSDENSLFTQGFRGRKARQTTFRGRGIGLAYCRQIMELIGGDLEFRREKGGACFVVKLRRAGSESFGSDT